MLHNYRVALRFRRNVLIILFFLLLAGCRTEPATPSPPAPTSGALVPAITPSPLPAMTPLPPSVSPTPPANEQAPIPAKVSFVPPDLRHLATVLDEELAAFDGLSSYTVVDLQTGQRIAHNPDLAIAGASLLKIPILLETYRVLNAPPDLDQTKIITETASLSGNFTANLLLELIAGRPDPFAGAEIMTTSMRRLGLYNTFMAVPYDLEPVGTYHSTYWTPANQQTEMSTQPDPARQTTTGDLASLLTMIYECTHARGLLLEIFADSLNPEECQQVLANFEMNRIHAFVELGVPADVRLAHKHGWIDDTHGDAALVFSAGGDYALVVALYAPGWLEWDISNPLIGELSRLTYAHFNDPGAYSAEQLALPFPALAPPTATPDLPQARVDNTRGAGLTLRETPGGAEILVLPEGMPVYLLAEPPQLLSAVSWQHVMTPQGQEGWVGSDFLTTIP